MTRKDLYKFCPNCQTRKSRDSFWKDASKKDGLWYACKECGKALHREHKDLPKFAERFSDEVHTKCGGRFVEFSSSHGGFDPEMVRCEKCRMVGVPI